MIHCICSSVTLARCVAGPEGILKIETVGESFVACSGLTWGSTSLLPEEDAYNMLIVAVEMLQVRAGELGEN